MRWTSKLTLAFALLTLGLHAPTSAQFQIIPPGLHVNMADNGNWEEMPSLVESQNEGDSTDNATNAAIANGEGLSHTRCTANAMGTAESANHSANYSITRKFRCMNPNGAQVRVRTTLLAQVNGKVTALNGISGYLGTSLARLDTNLGDFDTSLATDDWEAYAHYTDTIAEGSRGGGAMDTDGTAGQWITVDVGFMEFFEVELTTASDTLFDASGQAGGHVWSMGHATAEVELN